MARLADHTAGSPGSKSAGLQPFAFSSPRRLSAYLTAQDVEHWQLHLVSRYSAITYLTELQLLGYPTISVNADEDGAGGKNLQISELIESLTS